tara:strand:+ start:300 stop:488 length:189 start_codon:yes stop_codon:yes gene_type:complete
MTSKELLIMQSIAEFRKYKELELNKSKQEESRKDSNMAYYHKGKADGLSLLIQRLLFIENSK